MNISDKGIALIQHYESCKLKAYPDPGSGGDPWTIGWGATGVGIYKGTVWTQKQADDRLRADVAADEKRVSAAIGKAPTTQGQFDALVSFCFNLGIGNLLDSTLLRMHIARDHAGAAAQFARWNKASGRVLAGLTRRRAAEAAMYRGN